ncbi:hypothetical protein DBB_6210 [Desulfoluna spongiiphila]|nr:hypothetical protein DBB_6210 [Desulfoluna spongiiphila]
MVSQYENDRNMLPRGMSQGNLFALIDKPNTEFVIVVFGYKKLNFMENLKQRNNVAQTLLEIFSCEGVM